MPAPSSEIFDHLRSLVAIEHIGARPTRTVEEVFTGRPLADIPVGTADDVDAAFVKARAAQQDWASRPDRKSVV